MVHILKNSKPETNPNISLQQLAAVKKKKTTEKKNL